MKKKIVFIGFLFVLFACANNNKEHDANYEKTKETLAEKERKNPLHFLKIKSNDKKNLLGQTVVRGNITNTATVCSYKNVRIKMLTYTKEKMTEEHEDVLNDVIKPNSSEDFKLKYHLPKGTDSIALSVINAEVIE